jgi:hypothetical protein
MGLARLAHRVGVEGRSARPVPLRNGERAANVGMYDVVAPRSSAVNGYSIVALSRGGRTGTRILKE